MTGEIKDKREDEPKNPCKLCGYQNESLMHILNGCQSRKHKYTERHNLIEGILVEEIRKTQQQNKPIIFRNSTIRVNGEKLDGEESRLKPDIWYIKDNKLFIIEITIPYGQYTEDNRNTLEIRTEEKKAKYNNLVIRCQEKWAIETHLITIVASSLGVLTKESIQNVHLLTGYKGRR